MTRTLMVLVAMMGESAVALAQQQQPQTAIGQQGVGSSRPLLEQMDRETQGLFDEVRRGMVLVQMPAPIWLREIAVRSNPVNKWNRELDDQVRKVLEQEAREAQGGKYNKLTPELTPSTRPAAEPGTEGFDPGASAAASGRPTMTSTTVPTPGGGTLTVQVGSGAGGTVIMIGPSGAATQPGALMTVAPRVPASTRLVMNNIGVVLNGDGYLLVPLYVEEAAVGGKELPVAMPNGQLASAKFIGSDRPTNITLLKMDARPVKVLTFGGEPRPPEGSMVMVMATVNGGARLSMWAGGQQEAGVVVKMDGQVSGIVRYGQFLGMRACVPIVDQLIKHGAVRRAVLGVNITEVRREDPLRQQLTILGNRPAMRVHEVHTGSAAEKAGLKVDDLIISLEGEEVGDTPSFAAAISKMEGKSELEIIREGKIQKIDVDLEPK